MEQTSSRGIARRSDAELRLDLDVALRIEGYRWVAWNERALGESPLWEPGRFVGHPGDMLSHHYVPASPDVPLARQPYRRLPRYSVDAGLAFRAAERAGLFGGDGARLISSQTGTWTLLSPGTQLPIQDSSLPRLLCRASLQWLDASGNQGAC